MNKTLILVAVIVLVLGILGSAWWLNKNNGPVVKPEEDVSLTDFTYDAASRRFLAKGGGLSSIVVQAVPVGEADAENVVLGEMSLERESGKDQEWMMDVPKYPVQTDEIIAVAYKEDGSEVGRLSLAIQGANEIYNALWLQVPFKEAVLSVGESFTSDNITLKLIDVVEDSRCPAGVECIQAGRVTADLELTVDGKTSAISIRSDEGERRIGANYVTMVNVEPAAEEGKTLSATDYEITFYITEDIEKI